MVFDLHKMHFETYFCHLNVISYHLCTPITTKNKNKPIKKGPGSKSVGNYHPVLEALYKITILILFNCKLVSTNQTDIKV